MWRLRSQSMHRGSVHGRRRASGAARADAVQQQRLPSTAALPASAPASINHFAGASRAAPAAAKPPTTDRCGSATLKRANRRKTWTQVTVPMWRVSKAATPAVEVAAAAASAATATAALRTYLAMKRRSVHSGADSGRRRQHRWPAEDERLVANSTLFVDPWCGQQQLSISQIALHTYLSIPISLAIANSNARALSSLVCDLCFMTRIGLKLHELGL